MCGNGQAIYRCQSAAVPRPVSALPLNLIIDQANLSNYKKNSNRVTRTARVQSQTATLSLGKVIDMTLYCVNMDD